MKKQTTWTSIFVVLLLIGILVACAPAAQSPTSQAAAISANTSDSTVSPTATAASETEVSSDAADVAETTRINLNTATEADFLTIPGVGNRMVREFLEYRPYISITQFEREIGKYVDEAQVQHYEQYVYVPISANDSDAATLMQIAGLDESEAEALISARPYASNDAFLTELTGMVSETELAAAQSLLSNP